MGLAIFRGWGNEVFLGTSGLSLFLGGFMM
jgi:hypothetical protein